MEDQKALLNSLMGMDRNAGKKDQGRRQNWRDDEICKKYLAWECPHEFFSNQRGRACARSPLGECQKQHCDIMKERFQEDKECPKYKRRYLQDLERQMRVTLDALDVKLDREKEKLVKGQSCTKDAQRYVVTEIETRTTLVKDKLMAAEEMAASGEVDVSKTVYDEAMFLNYEQARLERLKEKTEGWIDEICDVCGAYISWRDPEEMRKRERGEKHSHYNGIVHSGWAQMRDSLARLKVELEKTKPDDDDTDDKRGDMKDSREDTQKRTREEEIGGDRKRPRDGRRDSGMDRDVDRERHRESDRGRRSDNPPDRDGRRDSDTDRRRESDRAGYNNGGRDCERDDGRNRERDERGDRRYRDERDDRRHREERDDRRGRDDRDGGRYREKDSRGDRDGRDDGAPGRRRDDNRQREERDEMGRSVKIANDYTEIDRCRGKMLDKWGDEVGKRDGDERSRSRENKDKERSNELPASGGDQCAGKKAESENVKNVIVPYSEDWEEVMEKKFEELCLEQDAWDMVHFDCKDQKIVDGQLDLDSFPLRFQFTKKSAGK